MKEKASALFWQLILEEQDTRQHALQILANEVTSVFFFPSLSTGGSVLMNGTWEMDSQGDRLLL